MKQCMYSLCRNTTTYAKPHEKPVKYYPFPRPKKDLDKCLRWISACNRYDEKLSVERLKKQTLYICSNHFVGGNGPTTEHPDPIVFEETGETLDLMYQSYEPPKATAIGRNKERNQLSITSVTSLLADGIHQIGPTIETQNICYTSYGTTDVRLIKQEPEVDFFIQNDSKENSNEAILPSISEPEIDQSEHNLSYSNYDDNCVKLIKQEPASDENSNEAILPSIISEPEIGLISEPEIGLISEPKIGLISEPKIGLITVPEIGQITVPKIGQISELEIDEISVPREDLITESKMGGLSSQLHQTLGNYPIPNGWVVGRLENGVTCCKLDLKAGLVITSLIVTDNSTRALLKVYGKDVPLDHVIFQELPLIENVSSLIYAMAVIDLYKICKGINSQGLIKYFDETPKTKGFKDKQTNAIHACDCEIVVKSTRECRKRETENLCNCCLKYRASLLKSAVRANKRRPLQIANGGSSISKMDDELSNSSTSKIMVELSNSSTSKIMDELTNNSTTKIEFISNSSTSKMGFEPGGSSTSKIMDELTNSSTTRIELISNSSTSKMGDELGGSSTARIEDCTVRANKRRLRIENGGSSISKMGDELSNSSTSKIMDELSNSSTSKIMDELSNSSTSKIMDELSNSSTSKIMDELSNSSTTRTELISNSSTSKVGDELGGSSTSKMDDELCGSSSARIEECTVRANKRRLRIENGGSSTSKMGDELSNSSTSKIMDELSNSSTSKIMDELSNSSTTRIELISNSSTTKMEECTVRANKRRLQNDVYSSTNKMDELSNSSTTTKMDELSNNSTTTKMDKLCDFNLLKKRLTCATSFED